MATPVVAAAGTYGYGLEFDGLVDWSMVGGISVKGISRDPCPGHSAPRMVETAAGVLNAIGLQNIGADAFVVQKLPGLRTLGPRIIVNCWGDSVEQYEAVVERLDGEEGIDALEINVSCPNRRQWGGVLAADTAATAAIVAAVRKKTRLPLWVKLSPNVTDITESARAAAGEGADALSLINTLRGMAIELGTRRPALSNLSGGLSGPAIKPVALCMVYDCVRAVEVPVVGIGGISSGRDAAEFLLAGASAVQVGTANLYDPAAPARISSELETVLEELGESSVSSVIGTLRTS